MTAVDTNAARTIARHDQCRTCDGEGCPDCYHTGLTPLANVTLALCDVTDALCDEVNRLRAIEEWARDANHHAGCSGEHGPQYKCKCGRRDLFPERWADMDADQ